MSDHVSTIRGSCVSIDGAGVLLRGVSGCGKSDLALRLLDQGALLVSDDYVAIRVEQDRIMAAAPDAIRGLIELRGVGLLHVPYRENVALALVLDLIPSFRVTRLPEPQSTEIEGVSLPLFALAPFEASAPAKVRMLLHALQNDGFHAQLRQP